MQTQDPKGAPAVLGGAWLPQIHLRFARDTQSVPELGRAMGGTDQLPQCHWAGSPVGGAGVSLGRGRTNSHRNPQPCPPAGLLAGPRGALQGQIPGSSTAHPDLEVPKSSWGDAVTEGLALLGGTQHATASAGASLGPHTLLQHNSYP